MTPYFDIFEYWGRMKLHMICFFFDWKKSGKAPIIMEGKRVGKAN